jgi:hypothetical protein
MLARVGIQHQLDQGALQARERPSHDSEPRTRNAAGRLEVEKTEILTQIDMVLRLETQSGGLSPAPHLGIIRLRRADGHVIGQQVRQAQLYVIQLRLNFLKRGLVTLQLVAQVLDRSQQWLDILALRFRFANALGAAVALAAQRLCFHLQRFTALLERKVVPGVKCESASSKIPSNLCGGLAE